MYAPARARVCTCVRAPYALQLLIIRELYTVALRPLSNVMIFETKFARKISKDCLTTNLKKLELDAPVSGYLYKGQLVEAGQQQLHVW